MSGAGIKLIAQAVGGLGVGKVVGDIVKTNVITPQTTAQALLIKAGGFVLCSMVTEQALDHIGRTIDGVANSLNITIEKKKEEPPTTT